MLIRALPDPARRFLSGLAFCVLTLASVPRARCEDILPYTTRTRPYGGWTTPAKGDIRTVGMAGATTGLADTFLAATSNPAGLALTLKDADTNFTTDRIHNGYIQNFDNVSTTANYGAALDLEPWGFSIGYLQPYREGQPYQLLAAGNPIVDINVTIREFDVSVARFFRDIAQDTSLAIGAVLTLGQGEEEIDVGPQSNAFHPYSIGTTLGVLLKTRRRILVGMSYSTGMRYDATNTSTLGTSTLGSFYQPIDVPPRLNLGVGWIPNRYFRMDVDLQWVGATPSAALLRDQSVSIGIRNTLQPRIGLAYNVVDFKEFQSTAFLGSYYEMSRIDGTRARTHVTSGVEFKPWILSLGWGIDTAPQYMNYLFGIGVDIVKLAEKIDIIPPLPHAPHAGFLPNPEHFLDEGLATPLIRRTQAMQTLNLNPIDIGLSVPRRIGQKMQSLKDAIIGPSPTDDKPKPEPEKRPSPKITHKAKAKTQPGAQKKKKKTPDP